VKKCNVIEKTVDQTVSTEMKRKIAEQSSFTLSHSNQEQFKWPTAIKKFKMGEEDDMIFQETKLEPSFLSFANRNCSSGYFSEPLGSTLNTISSNKTQFSFYLLSRSYFCHFLEQ
jgi:hypothetical protein